MSTGMPELGSKISLISKADIRYEGRLFTVDPQECTIALANVKSFGTEDRETQFPVMPENQAYEYILFRGSDIKDIRVVNNSCTLPNDPAIVQMAMQPNSAGAYNSHSTSGMSKKIVSNTAATLLQYLKSAPFLKNNKRLDERRHCICRSRNTEGDMVCCDRCSIWFHMHCLDVMEKDVSNLKNWFCDTCQEARTSSRSKFERDGKPKMFTEIWEAIENSEDEDNEDESKDHRIQLIIIQQEKSTFKCKMELIHEGNNFFQLSINSQINFSVKCKVKGDLLWDKLLKWQTKTAYSINYYLLYPYLNEDRTLYSVLHSDLLRLEECQQLHHNILQQIDVICFPSESTTKHIKAIIPSLKSLEKKTLLVVIVKRKRFYSTLQDIEKKIFQRQALNRSIELKKRHNQENKNYESLQDQKLKRKVVSLPFQRPNKMQANIGAPSRILTPHARNANVNTLSRKLPATSTPKVTMSKKIQETKASTSQQHQSPGVSQQTNKVVTKTPQVKKPTEPENLRMAIRKNLAEMMLIRIKETTDLKLSEEEVNELVLQIELELYKLFKDTGAKYKARYCRLLFNIKDPKNLTLFRKIADRSISPEALVKLSSVEMASEELAAWRENETKNQLERYKKNI